MTDPADPADALPASWSSSAREVYLQITEEHPDLDVTTLASLYEACSMLATADSLSGQVEADGLMVPGSKGQPVAHPLVAEARMHRTAGLAALRALGLARRSGPAQSASAAGAALVGARWGRR